jgi:hypothetical protein
VLVERFLLQHSCKEDIERMIGVHVEQILLMLHGELIHGEFEERVVQILLLLMLHGELIHVEFEERVAQILLLLMLYGELIHGEFEERVVQIHLLDWALPV